MFAWFNRARRWKWVDTALVRVEAYTALVEQYPAVKWAIRAAAGAMIAFWTWISESWVPLAIVAGLGAFVALSFLPQAMGAEARNAGPEKTLDQDFSDDPESEALDKPAYNQIVAFCMDHLFPTCEAQIELQNAIVRSICTNEQVASLAIEGLRNDLNYKTHGFWENYEKLASGLCGSPGPLIKFEGIIDCIHELEREYYKNLLDQCFELAKSTGQELKNVAPAEWMRWLFKHNQMADAYAAISRDIRFGKLHRLRPSRWGSYQP